MFGASKYAIVASIEKLPDSIARGSEARFLGTWRLRNAIPIGLGVEGLKIAIVAPIENLPYSTPGGLEARSLDS